MIELFDVQSGSKIGDITEAQLQFLVDQLEEENLDDQDYYINPATLDHFQEEGADSELLTLLRTALGENESMDIRWQKG